MKIFEVIKVIFMWCKLQIVLQRLEKFLVDWFDLSMKCNYFFSFSQRACMKVNETELHKS